MGYIFIKARHQSNSASFKKLSGNNVWKYITIACSCYVAFSIGSNNVANSAGPLVSLAANQLGSGGDSALIMLLSILLVAPWFGIGSALLGRGVTKAIGQEIIQIGVLGATFISVITATLLLLASTTLGIPTSLVQMNTFAVIAVGMLKIGPRQILTRLSILKLFTVWIVAPIFALVIAYAMTTGALKIGLLNL